MRPREKLLWDLSEFRNLNFQCVPSICIFNSVQINSTFITQMVEYWRKKLRNKISIYIICNHYGYLLWAPHRRVAYIQISNRSNGWGSLKHNHFLKLLWKSHIRSQYKQIIAICYLKVRTNCSGEFFAHGGKVTWLTGVPSDRNPKLILCKLTKKSPFCDTS